MKYMYEYKFFLHMYAPVKSSQQHQSLDTLSFTCFIIVKSDFHLEKSPRILYA